MILSLNDGANGYFITKLQYGLTKWASPCSIPYTPVPYAGKTHYKFDSNIYIS